jgi:uncharacterized protein YndB with AHSA1/START domain
MDGMPARAQATILIDAPVEKVFRYLTDPEKQLEWIATDVRLVEVKERRRLANGGWFERVVLQAGRKRFEVTSEDLEVVPNTLIVGRTNGVLSRSIFQSEGAETRVTHQLEGTVPWMRLVLPQLGSLIAQRLLAGGLDRAKAALEGRPLPERRARLPLESIIPVGIAILALVARHSISRALLGHGLLAGDGWLGVVLDVVTLWAMVELSSAGLRQGFEKLGWEL